MLFAALLAAHAQAGKMEDASALTTQADAISQVGTVTLIDNKGLQIDGSDLTGMGVERPEALYRRAAELLAEVGDDTGNSGPIGIAMKRWQRVNDPYSPVGYLHRTADKYRTRNPALATYCDVEISRCYLAQGDAISALKILAPYAAIPLNSEPVGRAQAIYARQLLAFGRFDEAAQIAKAVKTRFYSENLTYDFDDACSIAMSVLLVIPASEHGTAAADSKALKSDAQKQNFDANPRLCYGMGLSALSAGNRTLAITYWQQYRKLLPNDEQSRRLVAQIAEQYVALGNPAKAIDIYKDGWTSYSDFQEGWQARIAASRLQERAGQNKEALAQIAEGLEKTTTAEGKASLLARQAELNILNHQPDDAFDCYLTLLSQYGNQTASRDAYKNLSKQTTQVKDWRRSTTEIKNWLIGKDTNDKPGKYGNTTLNLVGRSQLRRLALTFFVQQNAMPEAGNWLQSVGYASDPIERQAIIRDEAWLDGQIPKYILSLDLRRVTFVDIDNAIRTGLRGWDISPATEEGMQAFQAAYQLALRNPNPRSNGVRDVIHELEDLRGTDRDEMARQLLLPLYQLVGDKRSVQTLQQQQ